MIGLPSLTKIIKHIIIINVLVFLAVYMTPLHKMVGQSMQQFVSTLSFHFPTLGQFKPWQVITHMFMHGDMRHLLFNMLGLFFLGPYVEQYLGDKKFLQLYFAAGMGALIAHLVVGYSMGYFNPVLGASGAVYGVFVAYATLYPNRTLMIIPIPVPIKSKWIVLAYIAYDLYSGVARTGTGIAHFAHLGGALVGFLLIMYWKKNRFS